MAPASVTHVFNDYQLIIAPVRHAGKTISNYFQLFPNKGLERSLKQPRVCCTHKKDGCQWTAELGELDQHLNKHKEAGEGKARHEASFPTNFSVRSAVITC